MRITIDTKTDSKDEIRKAIKMLMGLVGTHGIYTNEQPEAKPEPTPSLFDTPNTAMGNLMNMFDSAPSTPVESPQPEETKDEDIPQVEFY